MPRVLKRVFGFKTGKSARDYAKKHKLSKLAKYGFNPRQKHFLEYRSYQK